MPERLHPTPPPVAARALRELLAVELDPHDRQRELVRISLIACPPGARAGAARRG